MTKNLTDIEPGLTPSDFRTLRNLLDRLICDLEDRDHQEQADQLADAYSIIQAVDPDC